MFNSLSPILRDLLNALLIGLAGVLVAILVSSFSRLFKKTWGWLIGNLIAVVILFYTIKLILDVAHGVGVVVVLGTILTGALILGSEHIAADIVAGLKLFVDRPFKAGNHVFIAGQTGNVVEIGLTYTSLLDNSGDTIIVRNSDVVTGTIINYSTRPAYRVAVKIAVPASQDLEQTIAAIQQGIKDFSPESKDEDYKPEITCETLIRGIMEVTVAAFISGELNIDLEKTRLMAAALRALRLKNISLEYRGY